jgi:hypothetical protein
VYDTELAAGKSGKKAAAKKQQAATPSAEAGDKSAAKAAAQPKGPVNLYSLIENAIRYGQDPVRQLAPLRVARARASLMRSARHAGHPAGRGPRRAPGYAVRGRARLLLRPCRAR